MFHNHIVTFITSIIIVLHYFIYIQNNFYEYAFMLHKHEAEYRAPFQNKRNVSVPLFHMKLSSAANTAVLLTVQIKGSAGDSI